MFSRLGQLREHLKEINEVFKNGLKKRLQNLQP